MSHFDYVGAGDYQYDSELMSGFLADTTEYIDEAEGLILKIESAPGESDRFGVLLGVMHTIKGNAGFLNLREVVALAHAVEQFIEPHRNGIGEMPPQGIDLLFEAVDAFYILMRNLKNRCEFVENKIADPSYEQVNWRNLVARLGK